MFDIILCNNHLNDVKYMVLINYLSTHNRVTFLYIINIIHKILYMVFKTLFDYKLIQFVNYSNGQIISQH